MRKLFVVTIATLFAFSMNAQKIGIKAGVNMSGYTTNFNTPDESKMGTGVNFGLFTDYEISEMLNLRANLTYNQLGSDYFDTYNSGSTVLINDNVDYLNLSIAPKFDFGSAYLYVGPYLGYAVTFNSVYTYKDIDTGADDNSYQESENKFFNKNDASIYNKADFGLNLGIGTSFSNILVELNVGYGMANFFNRNSQEYKDLEEEAAANNALLAIANATGVSFDIEDWMGYNNGEVFVAPIQRNLFFGFSVGYMLGE